MDDERENYLQTIYFDPSNPASFGGPSKLFHYVQDDGQHDFTFGEIKHWLQGEETFLEIESNLGVGGGMGGGIDGN